MEQDSSSRSWIRGLNESGVLEELDENLVDKLVLSDGLDHEHPLLPEEPQHHGHFHFFIVLQAVDHQLRKNDHAGPSHPGTAVDDDRRVLVLGAFQHAVGMATDRLDLLQVGQKSLDILWAAMIGPVSILQMPHGPFLSRQKVLDLQAGGCIATRICPELCGDLELAIGG